MSIFFLYFDGFLFITYLNCRIPWISKVYIAVPPLEIPKIEDLAENLHPEKFTIIPGGNTRHRSIHNGLKEAENGEFTEVSGDKS